ncbi:hypothetical protein F3Y22_tig00112968pilonHSYRG00020 [Hibiscus syriacus]|uniref:Reverse transcriptase domain-containing protein n=1 Tax=Hibiscus syriacus TaxID=106335 RepID=A0A6A2WSH9_HIBSY|nr:hypothetical protein F3Y22_tig00112968pilonHSYRG00020 [Hibiscus syriacus]
MSPFQLEETPPTAKKVPNISFPFSYGSTEPLKAQRQPQPPLLVIPSIETQKLEALEKGSVKDLAVVAHVTGEMNGGAHTSIRNCLAQLYAKDITPDDKQELDEALQREVFPEEACASQHRLLVLVFRVRQGRNTHRRAKLGFGTTNSNNAVMLWKNMTNFIREVGKNTLGLSTGKVKNIKNRGGGTTKYKLRDSIIDGSTDHHTTANDCPTSRIGIEEVKMDLRKMGRDKAVGPYQIPITVWLALREEGVKWLTHIFNIILESAKMLEEWRESTVIPIYKNKGDPQRCANYRGIKLLSHTMKLWERVIEARYTTHVRTTVGDTEAFPVEIELHQGSALSPYIFALIMDDIYCAIPDSVPWCMLFADDIVLIAETKFELNSRLATWKTALEEKGLRINIGKTEYLCSNFSGNQNGEDLEVCIEGHVLPSKYCFKYLGSMIHKDGGVDDDVSHRIKAGWLKWRAANGVLCDKKDSMGHDTKLCNRMSLGVVPVSKKLRREDYSGLGMSLGDNRRMRSGGSGNKFLPMNPTVLFLVMLETSCIRHKKGLVKVYLMFLEPLKLCYRSLCSCGDQPIVDGTLLDFLKQVSTFGLTLVRLDIRQESDRHTDVIDAITNNLEIGSYREWSEEKSKNGLSELSGKRPLFGPDLQKTEEIVDFLDTFHVIAKLPVDIFREYIILMATAPSDVLAVELLQCECRVKQLLRVVPIFEKPVDLEVAPTALARLFSIDWYRNRINGKQEVMIGYSGLGKDAGRFSTAWQLYKAQEELINIAKKFGVKFTMFHGHGGTVGRGGGPNYKYSFLFES